MRDPHVTTLHYAVSSGEDISYRDPPPVSFSNEIGAFELRDGKLRVDLTQHFPDQKGAREAVEQFLRAWEIESHLNSGTEMLRFHFARAELIDRDPLPPGSPRVAEAKGIATAHATVEFSGHATYGKYPPPPQAFQATLEVLEAHRRWVGYRAGREPLQSMANFVLTRLESAAGGRKGAAIAFEIDKKVLNKIGQICATKGDPSTARKAPKGGFQDLTPAEKRWLVEMIPRVIHRLGERASGKPLTRISLGDLPP